MCKPRLKHVLLLTHEKLEAVNRFIVNNCPFVNTFLEPHSHRESWLHQFAATSPSVQSSPFKDFLTLTLDQLKNALTGILNYYNHKDTNEDPYKFTAEQLIDILKNPNSDKYPNLHPYALAGEQNGLNDLMKKMREKEVFLDAANGIIDTVTTTLVFISRAGAVTGFHLDWTEAMNVALLIEVCVALPQ